MSLLLAVLFVILLVAVLGGVYVSNLLWLLLIVALVVLIVGVLSRS